MLAASHLRGVVQAAELSAAFLSVDLALIPEPRADHAAYIASWLKVLKKNKRSIFSNAAHAQRAADYRAAQQPQADEAERAAA